MKKYLLLILSAFVLFSCTEDIDNAGTNGWPSVKLNTPETLVPLYFDDTKTTELALVSQFKVVSFYYDNEDESVTLVYQNATEKNPSSQIITARLTSKKDVRTNALDTTIGAGYLFDFSYNNELCECSCHQKDNILILNEALYWLMLNAI